MPGATIRKKLLAKSMRQDCLVSQFFGERFSLDDVRSFKPDVMIDGRTDVTYGGTRVELIPVHGGETHDAMFFHLPDQGVMFVGGFHHAVRWRTLVEEAIPGTARCD